MSDNSNFSDDIMSSTSEDEFTGDENERSHRRDDGRSRPKGLAGLQNMGNTCYMNAALQSLSNCPQLTRYMLDCGPFVRKPGLAKSYMRLIKEIWSPKRPNSIAPTGIAHGIKSVCPLFKGYNQHDTQEFLRCFLDQMHEELKDAVYGYQLEQREYNIEGLSSEPAPFGDEMLDEDHEANKSLLTKERRNSHDGPDSTRSGSPSVKPRNERTGSAKKKPVAFRSIISDVFDGKLLSSVQCLTCDNVSTTKETFQDLSLPIPSREQLQVLRAAHSGSAGSSPSSSPAPSPTPLSRASSDVSLVQSPAMVYYWVWSWFEWVIGWVWGPTVSLQDCLSAFFSADELKGDNMYSCDKCKKLRNGVKYSKVVQLPDILSIHLKRFRHELMYSSKISSQVTFPLEGLDMSPYIANDLEGNVTTYDLTAVICHRGTPAFGHYTSYCLNANNQQWYEFDDQCVTAVDPHQVAYCEAYVLFYRKTSEDSMRYRQRAIELMKLSRSEPSLLQFYVSKQWINRFNTFAEPGAITNYDFLCEHGSVDPDKAGYVNELYIVISRSVWEYLHSKFGGGPVCNKLFVCSTCTIERKQLDRRRKHEYDNFQRLNAMFSTQRNPAAVHFISMAWFNKWEAFITKKTDEPPGLIENNAIATTHPRTGQTMVKVGSDHATISSDMWNFFYGIYGGGPTVNQVSRQRTNTTSSNERHNQSSSLPNRSDHFNQDALPTSRERNRTFSSLESDRKYDQYQRTGNVDHLDEPMAERAASDCEASHSGCLSDQEEEAEALGL
ncbi:Ubiquitin carboxyl-terminal hydrolase 20 [Halotydeus destructor]|nr:Ubiquitin carboxyl-terminal hydrolase 20 [Halotydeus destructor]